MDHQYLIEAIMIDIQPSLFDHLMYGITKPILKAYIHKVREAEAERLEMVKNAEKTKIS